MRALENKKSKMSMFIENVGNVFENIKCHLFLLIPIVATFYANAVYAIMILFIMMVLDTYWGLRLAKFEGKERTTNRFMDFFAKLIGYFFFATIAVLLDFGLHIPYIIWIVCGIPIIIEFLSIDEKQRKMGKDGIIKKLNTIYKVALRIKKKRDDLR